MSRSENRMAISSNYYCLCLPSHPLRSCPPVRSQKCSPWEQESKIRHGLKKGIRWKLTPLFCQETLATHLCASLLHVKATQSIQRGLCTSATEVQCRILERCSAVLSCSRCPGFYIIKLLNSLIKYLFYKNKILKCHVWLKHSFLHLYGKNVVVFKVSSQEPQVPLQHFTRAWVELAPLMPHSSPSSLLPALNDGDLRLPDLQAQSTTHTAPAVIINQ